MSPENFCFWLQGYFEIGGGDTLSPNQVQVVKDHLGLVFKKETPDRNIKPGWNAPPYPGQDGGMYIDPDTMYKGPIYDTRGCMIGESDEDGIFHIKDPGPTVGNPPLTKEQHKQFFDNAGFYCGEFGGLVQTYQ